MILISATRLRRGPPNWNWRSARGRAPRTVQAARGVNAGRDGAGT